MNLNRIFLLGRLTRDPELRSTPQGQKVVGFSMATNRTWHDKLGKKQEEVEFHNVVAWAKLAETIAQYTHKGDLLFVDGRMHTREWKDKDNNNHKTAEVIAEAIQFGPKATPKAEEQKVEEHDEGMPDLPF